MKLEGSRNILLLMKQKEGTIQYYNIKSVCMCVQICICEDIHVNFYNRKVERIWITEFM